MVPAESIPELMDRLVVRSYVNAANVLMQLDRHQCRERVASVIERLRSGAYLIGTGPGTLGIIPLSVDRVVLGRAATPMERPCDTVVDVQASDASYLGPHEVSRTHAAVEREFALGQDNIYRLIDLDSTCGTFLNGVRVNSGVDGHLLESGDVLSLGSSHSSTFLFLNKNE